MRGDFVGAYHSVEWYASGKLVLADSQSFVFLAFSGGVVAQKLAIGCILVDAPLDLGPLAVKFTGLGSSEVQKVRRSQGFRAVDGCGRLTLKP